MLLRLIRTSHLYTHATHLPPPPPPPLAKLPHLSGEFLSGLSASRVQGPSCMAAGGGGGGGGWREGCKRENAARVRPLVIPPRPFAPSPGVAAARVFFCVVAFIIQRRRGGGGGASSLFVVVSLQLRRLSDRCCPCRRPDTCVEYLPLACSVCLLSRCLRWSGFIRRAVEAVGASGTCCRLLAVPLYALLWKPAPRDAWPHLARCVRSCGILSIVQCPYSNRCRRF